MNDILQVQGRMTMGYGIIPKMAMQDKRLTIEAKAIYAYFCSYAGAGTTAFPSRDKIVSDLQLGVKRYYSHFNILKDCGYIKVEQSVDEKGKFKRNIYTLIEMIDLSNPCSQNDHTDGPCGRYAYTDNDHTINNSIKNNNISYNILSNPIESVLLEKEKTDSIGYDEISNQSVVGQNKKKKKESSHNAAPDKSNKHLELSTPEYDYNTVLEKIKENINYDCMITDNPNEKDMIDGITHVITTTIITEYSNGYISMGDENTPAEAVKTIFLKLNKDDIEYFISNFNKQTAPTTKLNAYIRTSLYRNYGAKDFYFANRARVDMPYIAEITP